MKFPYTAKGAAAQTEFPPSDASEAERWISGGVGEGLQAADFWGSMEL